jgi:putative phage-type endonuclease
MNTLLTDKQAWLKLRKNFIGASDAPVVLGVSPWKTPYQLWQEKLGISSDQEETPAMRYGTNLEETARRAYEKYTGSLMVPEIVYHAEKKYMMATLDGLSPNGDMAVEIKCPNESDHNLAKSGKVPEHYKPQLQHQLACLNINQLHYFSYRNGEGIIVEVEKDELFIQNLYSKEDDFWNCVQNLEAPELTNRDYENLELSEQWKDLAFRFKQRESLLKSLEEEEKKDRAMLIKLSGGKSAIGHGIRLTKIIRKGNVDYKSIPELKNVDLEKYRKEPTESWRLATI